MVESDRVEVNDVGNAVYNDRMQRINIRHVLTMKKRILLYHQVCVSGLKLYVSESFLRIEKRGCGPFLLSHML